MKPSRSQCKSCGADIWWAKTKAGANMPVDAEPVGMRGNCTLKWRPGTGELFVKVWPRPTAVPVEIEHRYTSHFVTCPNANEHRKLP